MSDDSDHPQVTLVGIPDSHGFMRVTHHMNRPSMTETQQSPLRVESATSMPTKTDDTPDPMV